MSPTKLTPDDVDWRKVTFRECGVHKEILFACEHCPVCVAIEERDEALGKAEYDITQLEGALADAEERIDAYRQELRL